MRKIIVASVIAVLLAGTAWAEVNITAENFPDTEFRSYVSETFDSDSNGILSDAEIAEVKKLPIDADVVSGVYLMGGTFYTLSSQSNALSTVHDFTGIEYFTSLEALYYEELFRYGQQNLLEAVDLSRNTALKYLHFCPAHLDELNLSANTELLCVECPQIGLLSIDVSNCSNMTTLDCSSNDLTALDLSGCSAVVSLNCSGNSLASLDVSALSRLGSLSCAQNHLARLDLVFNNYITAADCTSQSITGSYVTHRGDAYELDISTIIPADELTRITELTAYDSANNAVSITTGGGYIV